jgi:hypothetical protein
MDQQAVALVIPNTGSGPVNVFEETFLANASAFSLPATPRCPGTHTTATISVLPASQTDGPDEHLHFLALSEAV